MHAQRKDVASSSRLAKYNNFRRRILGRESSRTVIMLSTTKATNIVRLPRIDVVVSEGMGNSDSLATVEGHEMSPPKSTYPSKAQL